MIGYVTGLIFLLSYWPAGLFLIYCGLILIAIKEASLIRKARDRAAIVKQEERRDIQLKSLQLQKMSKMGEDEKAEYLLNKKVRDKIANERKSQEEEANIKATKFLQKIRDALMIIMVSGLLFLAYV
ncbi:hypothetical protein Sps_00548 [Shewanella psychrophila]|uniref:Uncharacterized protein n=1 Tax=Shewanella psychrophila TaxID=225848 RepID=A0A1S6HJP3_9GAMM|nr:hypothetical protein [Shewanella psychrophila]AQS35746.1 hypothetical protein Sps_00548 [Shewanella psychrophila]